MPETGSTPSVDILSQRHGWAALALSPELGLSGPIPGFPALLRPEPADRCLHAQQGLRAGPGFERLKHIPSGWNQPDGMCPVNMAFGTTRFQSDGTARGSIRPDPALLLYRALVSQSLSPLSPSP